MERTSHIEAFLSLVRLGIGHTPLSLPESIDWEQMAKFSRNQGLLAIVLDGMEALSKSGLMTDGRQINLNTKLKWINGVIGGYEKRYPLYEKAIETLARFYNSNGFRMMVLKGYGLSLNYPAPSHRPCGDIDIWLFGKYKEADALIAQKAGIRVDNSHHHHTVFNWNGTTVENHYDIVNVHTFRGAELESLFKELANDDSHFVEVGGEIVYLPSPNLHALFLLRHSIHHFVSTSINIRQILDWAFFAKAKKEEIDWPWLSEVLERFGMTRYFSAINEICVDNLGFDADIFPKFESDKKLCSRIIEDSLYPGFAKQSPKGLFKRVLFKYQRWHSNDWKRRLCYNESSVTNFIRSTWAHFLKPKSI